MHDALVGEEFYTAGTCTSLLRHFYPEMGFLARGNVCWEIR